MSHILFSDFFGLLIALLLFVVICHNQVYERQLWFDVGVLLVCHALRIPHSATNSSWSEECVTGKKNVCLGTKGCHEGE